jgi:hypothetical protein
MTDNSALHAHFLQAVKPIIERQSRVSFRQHHRNPEKMEELTQEATALAWKRYVDLCDRDKRPDEFVTTFAELVCRAVRNGRKAIGQERASSVSNPHTQHRRGFFVGALPEHDSSEADTDLLRALTDNRHAMPPDQVQFIIDTNEWLKTLDRRKRDMVLDMASGETTTALSEKYDTSAGRISQIRRELVKDLKQFHGELEVVGR